MSKKKHPEHVNHERWLVSYADFITLLFAFFVVLFASGQSDKKKKTEVAIAIQNAFLHNGIFDDHSRIPPLTEENSPVNKATPSPLSLPIPTSPDLFKDANLEAQKIQQRVNQVVKAQVADRNVADGLITTHITRDGLVISMREASIFPSGSANICSESLKVINAVAATLPHQPMRVEGHTDNMPIHTAVFATNWELSTARAAAITRQLIVDHVVAPSQISAAGYAEFQPVADNGTSEGRAQNRRVDIVVLSMPPTTP